MINDTELTNSGITELLAHQEALAPDTPGIIRGGNAMGKILALCRSHLIAGTEPPINRQLLNDAHIYILGQKVDF